MIHAFDNFNPLLGNKCFIAETASVIGKVTIGTNASVWFGAVLRGDIERITIGACSNIQDNTVIHTGQGHPTVVGDHVTVGHNATLHGCTIGNNCLIGMGAILLDGCEISDHCFVAAGALVGPGRHIAPGSVAIGYPARVFRKLTKKEIADIQRLSEYYVGLKEQYRTKT